MKTRQRAPQKADYMNDIYKVRVDIAIRRWESGVYPRRRERSEKEEQRDD